MSDAGQEGNGNERTPDSLGLEPVWEAMPDWNELPDRVLVRIVRGDAKGRPFGTPRNPRLPTVQEFNPRIVEVRAGDLAGTITGRRHGISPEQAVSIARLSNEELMRYRPEDPVSAVELGSGSSLTGGHHRSAEIINRVQSGRLSPDTMIRILVLD
jgi:hypothetical protein